GHRLVPIFTGENTIANGEAMMNAEIHQAARALAGNDLVVRRLAANDAAEGDEAVGRAFGEKNSRRDLERARHAHRPTLNAGRIERTARTLEELIGNLRIEPRLDDQDAGHVALRIRATYRARTSTSRLTFEPAFSAPKVVTLRVWGMTFTSNQSGPARLTV